MNFLRRTEKVTLPERYAGLIDVKGYRIFLKKCLAVLKELGYKVLSSEDGDIVYEDTNAEAHFYLDNLLRKYLQSEEGDKDSEIIMHFTKLKDQTTAYNYLYKDFEYAKQFLKVLLKADDVLPNNEDLVYQKHFPKLLTFLVLDFEEQFYYVGRVEADQWEVDEKELFEIALNNVREEEIDIKQVNFDNKYDVFALFSGDFSASCSLLIEQELEFAIGKFGTLIALPTKGSTFLYPIETDNVSDIIVSIYPTTEQFFNEDPGNLTLDFYWFYQGRFEIFEKTPNEDGSITIHHPEKLIQLLEQ